MAQPARPFGVAMSDSIRIVLEENKLDDALVLISSYAAADLFPHCSTTRMLFSAVLRPQLSTATSPLLAASARQTAAFVVLYSSLLGAFGSALFEDVWTPSSASSSFARVSSSSLSVSASSIYSNPYLPAASPQVVQGQMDQTFWQTVLTIWLRLVNAVHKHDAEQEDKMNLLMDLMVNIAMLELNPANSHEPSRFSNVIIGKHGQRSGLPTGIAEAVDGIIVMCNTSANPAVISKATQLAAKWFNALSSYSRCMEGSEYKIVLADKAREAVRTIAVSSTGAGNFESSRESNIDDCDGDADRDLGSDQADSIKMHQTHIMSTFLRLLPPSDFRCVMADSVLVASSIFCQSSKHLIKTPPNWSKVLGAHLMSKPAWLTPETVRLHAQLIACVLDGLDRTPAQNTAIQKLVKELIAEISDDLSVRRTAKSTQDWAIALQQLGQ